MANYGGYGYQYETSPKKLQPEYVPTKKAKKKTNVKPQNTKKPSKQQTNKYNYKPVVYIGLAFVTLFTISYRYSLINEEYNSKENIKSKVSAVQKENEQLMNRIPNIKRRRLYAPGRWDKKNYYIMSTEQMLNFLKPTNFETGNNCSW